MLAYVTLFCFYLAGITTQSIAAYLVDSSLVLILYVVYFIQYHWSSLSLLSFAAKWLSIVMKAVDFMQRQPHGSPVISLISAFSMSSNLNLDLHFYAFDGVGSLHNNAIILSTVFDQFHRPFYCFWSNQSSTLPCLTYYIILSTVFNGSYNPIYCVSLATVLWKFEFLSASQNWWHFWSLDCFRVYGWY